MIETCTVYKSISVPTLSISEICFLQTYVSQHPNLVPFRKYNSHRYLKTCRFYFNHNTIQKDTFQNNDLNNLCQSDDSYDSRQFVFLKYAFIKARLDPRLVNTQFHSHMIINTLINASDENSLIFKQRRF